MGHNPPRFLKTNLTTTSFIPAKIFPSAQGKKVSQNGVHRKTQHRSSKQDQAGLLAPSKNLCQSLSQTCFPVQKVWTTFVSAGSSNVFPSYLLYVRGESGPHCSLSLQQAQAKAQAPAAQTRRNFGSELLTQMFPSLQGLFPSQQVSCLHCCYLTNLEYQWAASASFHP